MTWLHRTNSQHPEFIHLVRQLDAYLAEVDGDDHAFYDQFNSIDNLKHVVVAFNGDDPVGCGAIKEYDPQTVEIKRMYTSPDSRGKGIASLILEELEKWAKELNYHQCILETGKKQVEAINLYQKCGYQPMDNYGQYEGVENSICMKKTLL
ncbi:MAG TPA: GNAT family N-acetyltransferase [Saprospiraceae bacterium]|nr:GNAT family N-acetyltransferase [Saprospiraceae bacterium]